MKTYFASGTFTWQAILAGAVLALVAEAASEPVYSLGIWTACAGLLGAALINTLVHFEEDWTDDAIE